MVHDEILVLLSISPNWQKEKITNKKWKLKSSKNDINIIIQILEKYCKYSGKVHLCLVDFKKEYDSIFEEKYGMY